MRPKTIAENNEFEFIVMDIDGVICAVRYNKKYGCYTDCKPCPYYSAAVKAAKDGAKGKWFD